MTNTFRMGWITDKDVHHENNQFWKKRDRKLNRRKENKITVAAMLEFEVDVQEAFNPHMTDWEEEYEKQYWEDYLAGEEDYWSERAREVQQEEYENELWMKECYDEAFEYEYITDRDYYSDEFHEKALQEYKTYCHQRSLRYILNSLQNLRDEMVEDHLLNQLWRISA